jgi:hypothetical protein
MYLELLLYLSYVLSCSCLCSSIYRRDYSPKRDQPYFNTIDNQRRCVAKVTMFGSL